MTASNDTNTCTWPQAVLFDLDGTLIDSAPDIAAAANQVLAAHNLEALTIEDIRSMIGNGVKKLVERAFARRDVILDEEGLDLRNEEMMKIYGNHLTNFTTKMTGADALLKELKAAGKKIAVVTNKPEAFSREIIDHFDWTDIVDSVVGGDTCPTRKPDPQMLHHACEQMGVTHKHAIMVGDSPADINSAKAAPMPTIAVRGGYTNIPVEELEADAVIDNLTFVMGSMSKINAPTA